MKKASWPLTGRPVKDILPGAAGRVGSKEKRSVLGLKRLAFPENDALRWNVNALFEAAVEYARVEAEMREKGPWDLVSP